TFQTLRLWSAGDGPADRNVCPTSAVGDGLADRNVCPTMTLQPASTVRSRFYLRLSVTDRPGVMAEVTRCLAVHHISIASIIQHEALEDHEGDTVPLVIMTHTAPTGHFVAAVADIDRLSCVSAPSVYYPVED